MTFCELDKYLFDLYTRDVVQSYGERRDKEGGKIMATIRVSRRDAYKRILQDLRVILRILKENPGMIESVADDVSAMKIDLVLREWGG